MDDIFPVVPSFSAASLCTYLIDDIALFEASNLAVFSEQLPIYYILGGVCATSFAVGGQLSATMSHTHELDNMGKSPHHSEVETPVYGERDAQVLARLGKKSVLEVHDP